VENIEAVEFGVTTRVGGAGKERTAAISLVHP